jgi:effector-binding domain-containing protein
MTGACQQKSSQNAKRLGRPQLWRQTWMPLLPRLASVVVVVVAKRTYVGATKKAPRGSLSSMLSPLEIIVNGSDADSPMQPPPPAAVIRLTIPRADIQSVMGPAIQEIIATLKAQNIAIAGPMFAHHFLTGEGQTNFDFEVGFPTTTTTTTTTTTPVANQGRVKSSTLPFATKTAKVTYTGPYEGLHLAWSDFGDQLAAARCVRLNTTMWEVYTVGPETTEDPTQWQTDLVVPIE